MQAFVTTVVLPYCCQLSSTRIFAVSYDRLTKSSDEMSTKNAHISVLVFVLWSTFRHSFSFVDEKNTDTLKAQYLETAGDAM